MTSLPSVASLGRRPYLILTLTTLIWAGNAVAGRLAVGQVSPMALTCLRWLVVLLLLLPLAGPQLLAERRTIARYAPFLFALGALGYTAFNALFYWAARYTTAVNMGVIQGIVPALVIAGGFLVHGTRTKPAALVGLAATLAGVVITASRGDVDVLRSLSFNIGDLGILLASTLYAGYTLALRNRPPLAPLTFFAVLAVAAFLTSLPLLGLEIASGAFQAPTPVGWALIGFVGIMPSLVAQLLFMRGVELIGPARAGLFMNLIPIFAALLGVVLLGETFTGYHAAALACVLGGIWVAERGRGPPSGGGAGSR